VVSPEQEMGRRLDPGVTLTGGSIQHKVLKLFHAMYSKSKFLPFSITVSLMVLSLLLLPCCEGQINDQSTDLYRQEAISSDNVVIAAVGDVMLSRQVGESIRITGDPRAPFLKTALILRKADIAFCNLESPFHGEGSPIEGEMVFGADPVTIEGLKYAGFDVVSLANNHFGDQGWVGMYFTLAHLDENGIEYIGAGKSESQAREPKIIERNRVKFALLGYSDIQSAIRKGYAATITRPGFAVLTKDNLIRDIQIAKKQAHIVIVSIHWGTEYEELPTERQKAFAYLAIDSGALLVIGHHPHIVQPSERYKDGYIFYSLGNFVFDQIWSENTRKGLIAKIIFEGENITEVETMKVTINDFYQPCLDDWE